MVKDAQKFVEELRLDLKLQHPTRSNRSRSGRREDRNIEVWRMDQERGAKAQESVANVLPGCSALAQTKDLYRHNAALKILHFELLRNHKLIESVSPWYSPTHLKPMYENNHVTAF